MDKKIGIGLCYALFNLGWLSAGAQEMTQDTIGGKTHQIEEVAVTARRLPHRISSPVPMQVMSQQDFGQLGIQDMADAVRRFAGTNVRDYGGIGGLKTVSVRNMGAAHTAVSYDGITVNNCQGGQIDIGRFALDNVSMLTLSIGQDEDLLQSARNFASAAVLSIQTEKPHFEGSRKSAFRVKVRGGSFGYITPSVRWWQQVGRRTRIALDGTFMRADGNYPFTLVNGQEVTQERRNNSAIHSWQGEVNLYHTLRDSSNLHVKGYYFYSKRGLPGAVTLYNPISREKLWDENTFLQARYTKAFNPQWDMQVQAKYTHGWNKLEDRGNQYEEGLSRMVHRQDEYYLSAAVRYQPLQGLTFSFAQDGVINKLRSTLADCPFPTRYTSLSAFHARYERHRFSLTASLLHTFVTEKVKEGEAPDDFNRLAPSVALNFRPWDDEALYVRLMYKSTFRMPTFNDLYYYQMGNRTLRPEKANEFNLGLTWSRQLPGWMDQLSLTLDGYYNDVTDKIVAFPTTYAWRMANFGTVHAAGIDATLGTSAHLGKHVNVVVSAGYTWQKAIDVTDATAKNYRDQLPYTPRHNGNTSLIVETPWVDVGYSAVSVGKRYFLSQNIPENEIDRYTEQTATLSRTFTWKGCKLSLRLEVINLADKQYDVIKYYPMPGRSWRVGGTIDF